MLLMLIVGFLCIFGVLMLVGMLIPLLMMLFGKMTK
jgi:hypothetical protein